MKNRRQDRENFVPYAQQGERPDPVREMFEQLQQRICQLEEELKRAKERP